MRPRSRSSHARLSSAQLGAHASQNEADRSELSEGARGESRDAFRLFEVAEVPRSPSNPDMDTPCSLCTRRERPVPVKRRRPSSCCWIRTWPHSHTPARSMALYLRFSHSTLAYLYRTSNESQSSSSRRDVRGTSPERPRLSQRLCSSPSCLPLAISIQYCSVCTGQIQLNQVPRPGPHCAVNGAKCVGPLIAWQSIPLPVIELVCLRLKTQNCRHCGYCTCASFDWRGLSERASKLARARDAGAATAISQMAALTGRCVAGRTKSRLTNRSKRTHPDTNFKSVKVRSRRWW